ncbi:MAG: iron-containing alcohol dehydrogenase [Sphaerochaetaceae bacterium]
MTNSNFLYYGNHVRTIAAMDALQQLSGLMAELSISDPLFLVSSIVRKSGVFDTVVKASGLDMARIEVIDGIPMGSSSSLVTTTIKNSRQHDSIIAIGGGSVIDTAKAVNLLISLGGDEISTYCGIQEITQPLLPLIVIPTTAGSGSEASGQAIIRSSKTGRMLLLSSSSLVPTLAIIDPLMTRSLSPLSTASGAMEALSRAIEATISLAANPITTAMACQAIGILFSSLLKTIQSPLDSELRFHLAMAAHLCGLASSQTMPPLTQSIGNAIVSTCQIPFSTCSAILLPYALEYNLHTAQKDLARLYRQLEPDQNNLPEAVAADLFIAKIRTLNHDLMEATGNSFPIRFYDCIGKDNHRLMDPQQFADIAAIAQGDISLQFSREELDSQDIIRILEASFWGYPLDRDIIRKGHQHKPIREIP